MGRGGVKVMRMHCLSMWHVTALIKNKKEKSSNLQYCYLAPHEKNTRDFSNSVICNFLGTQKFKFSRLFFVFTRVPDTIRLIFLTLLSNYFVVWVHKCLVKWNCYDIISFLKAHRMIPLICPCYLFDGPVISCIFSLFPIILLIW